MVGNLLRLFLSIFKNVRPSVKVFFILYSICHDFVPVVVYFWLYIFAIPPHFLVFSYANCESFTKKINIKSKWMTSNSFVCVFYGAVGWNMGFSRFHNRIKITHINFLCVHKSECQQLLLYSGIFAEVCVLNLSFMGYKQIVLTGL